MTRVTIIALNEMRRLNALSRQARKERRRMPSGPAKPRTPGIHPKLIAATVAAVATYLLAQPVLDLPDWVTVALASHKGAPSFSLAHPWGTPMLRPTDQLAPLTG
jgi:hypothetical protein